MLWHLTQAAKSGKGAVDADGAAAYALAEFFRASR